MEKVILLCTNKTRPNPESSVQEEKL
jgi:hypothetical protein